MGVKTRLLVTVKSYPLPSTVPAIKEHVCTAGVLEDGSFIRVYPINYRYKPYWQWYLKYQWIELELVKNKHDRRPESYSPSGDAGISIGEKLPSKRNWADRKRYVLAKGTDTMCYLRTLTLAKTEKSLAIIKPASVEDFIVEEDERDWKPAWKAVLAQAEIFGPKSKPLEKIPYKFSYRFYCSEPGCRGHTMMISDWELGQLYRSMRDKFQDERTAVAKVKQKFLDQMCARSIDTHFFVGTVAGHGTWIVLGVFWPKKENN